MREWLVAGGLVESPDGLLLVQNRRRDGSFDWTPPGGVIDVSRGESVRGGLTREVGEETGLVVDGWSGPVYQVEAVAERLGWVLRVEVHLAESYSGDLVVNDPDGIVVDAQFVPWDAAELHLDGSRRWVAEPLVAWLADRWGWQPAGGRQRLARATRSYRYRIEGDDARRPEVVRL